MASGSSFANSVSHTGKHTHTHEQAENGSSLVATAPRGPRDDVCSERRRGCLTTWRIAQLLDLSDNRLIHKASKYQEERRFVVIKRLQPENDYNFNWSKRYQDCCSLISCQSYCRLLTRLLSPVLFSAELYSYTEEPEFSLNRDYFEEDFRSHGTGCECVLICVCVWERDTSWCVHITCMIAGATLPPLPQPLRRWK